MISTLPTSEWFGVASPLVALFLGGALVLLSGTLAFARRRAWIPALGGVIFVAVSLALIFLLKPYIYTQQLPMDQIFVYDAYARHFQFVFLGLAALSLAAMGRGRPENDHPAARVALILFLCAGLTMLAVTADLVTLYVAGELVFVLHAVFAAAQPPVPGDPEAASVFLRRGMAVSLLLLLGTVLLCGLGGSTDLWEIAGTLQFVFFSGSDLPEISLRIPFAVALILFFSGWLARLESFPFQGWMAAAHGRYGPGLSVMLSSAMKAGAFAAIIRVLWILFTRHSREYPHEFPLVALISVLALLTLVVGTWKAMRAGSLRACLSWSGTVHVGLMMLGVAMMDRPGVEAVLVYLPVFSAMTAGVFMVLAAEGDEDHDPLQGLARRSRIAAAALTIFFMSLIGLPPTAGFAAKYILLCALLAREPLWFKLMAGAGILASILSAWIYGKIILSLWRGPMPGEKDQAVPPVHLAVAILLAILVLAAGLYWTPLGQAAQAAMMIIEYQY